MAPRGPAVARPHHAAPSRPRTFAVVAVVAAAVPLLGPSLALRATGEAAAPGAAGIAALRAVLFAALCVPVGEAYAGWLARRVPGAPVRRPPPSLAAPAATAGFLAALALACVVSAGNLIPQRLSDLNIGGLYRTRDGVLALVEVNAFLLAALWARARAGHLVALSRVLPPAAVIAAEALRAHPGTEPAPLIGSALTAVHLTCAALWTGGLWQVLRTVRLWRTAAKPGVRSRTGPRAMSADAFGARSADAAAPPSADGPAPPLADGAAAAPRAAAPPAVALLAGYARTAAVFLALLSLTGAVSAVRRMPLATLPAQLPATAYGRTLLTKVLLVAVAAAFALSARLRLRAARLRLPARLRRRVRPGAPPDPLAACSPARAELVVLGLVVVVSALLTALPVPIRW